LYPTVFSTINNNTDSKFFLYPFRKSFNLNFKETSFFNISYLNNLRSDINSLTQNYSNEGFLNFNKNNKVLTLLSSNQNFLPSEQTTSQYSNLLVNKTNLNLNNLTNLDYNKDSNLLLNDLYYGLKSN